MQAGEKTIGGFLCAAYFAVQEMPVFGYPLTRISRVFITQGFEKTGAANIVGSILLDYRALDMLVVVSVIFCAAVAIFSVIRKTGRKKADQIIEKYIKNGELIDGIIPVNYENIEGK